MAADLQQAIADAKAREELAAIVAQVVAQLPAAAPAGTACGCQHHHSAPAPAAPRSLARPLAVGGAVAATGCVLTGLFLAVALTAVAVAVGGVVVLFLLREYRKGGAR